MGIILYEFLIGCVPFYGDTPEELFSLIINGINLLASRFGIRAPLKSDFYFWFFPQTIGFESTTSGTRLQNLVKM